MSSDNTLPSTSTYFWEIVLLRGNFVVQPEMVTTVDTKLSL